MSSRKKSILFTRVKEISPSLCDKECNLKVIIMETNVKDDSTSSSSNVTLLIGDETACIQLVLSKSIAVYLRSGDIIHLLQPQVVFKNNRIYLWGGKIERVGEFIMLFKESTNMSTAIWTQDPKNADIMIPQWPTVKRLEQVKSA